MEHAIFGLSGFVITYLIYMVSVVVKERKLKKFMESNSQLKYLTNAYKLDLKEIEPKKQAKMISLTNSIIVGLVALIASFFLDNLIVLLMVSFVSLFPIILLSYFVLGKSLQKKYKKK